MKFQFVSESITKMMEYLEGNKLAEPYEACCSSVCHCSNKIYNYPSDKENGLPLTTMDFNQSNYNHGLNLLIEEQDQQDQQDYEEATFNLTFWDKTICSFGPKDSKKVHLLLNLTEHLSVIFGWIFLTLINCWLLKGLEYRSEWILLVILSVIPFYRNITKFSDLLCLIIIHFILDASVGTLIFHFYPQMDTSLLCLIIDLFTYLGALGSIRGFSIQTYIYASIFTYLNHFFDIHLIASGTSFFISSHAIGHSAYLGLGEFLVQLLLIRNQNFSNPIFGFDKSEMIHKFQYLRLSGKLERVPLPTIDLKHEPPNTKIKRKNHTGNRKNVSPKPKVNGDLQEEKTILRPSFGDILDSFELCSLESTATSLTVTWFIPINFLYLLSKSNYVIKNDIEEIENHSNYSSQHLDEIECPLTNLEVMNMVDVTFRVNGTIWSHWILNKDASYVSIIGLVPNTPYNLTMTIMGFRSSSLHLITKSVPGEANQSSLAYAQTIRQHMLLDQQLTEIRKLKKEESSLLKKQRRNLTQFESIQNQELQRIINGIDKALSEEVKQKTIKDKIHAEIEEIEKAVIDKGKAIVLAKESLTNIQEQVFKVDLQNNELRKRTKILQKEFNDKEKQFKTELADLQKGIQETVFDKKKKQDLIETSLSEMQKDEAKVNEIQSTVKQHEKLILGKKEQNSNGLKFLKFIMQLNMEEFNHLNYQQILESKSSIDDKNIQQALEKYNQIQCQVVEDREDLRRKVIDLTKLVESEDKFVDKLQTKHLVMQAEVQ